MSGFYSPEMRAGGPRAEPTEPPVDGSVERALIDCCSDLLSADILVLGHHGSMTSSREEFIDAVEARDFIVSSGPKRYGTVVLPDAQIVDLVMSRPNVRLWRTDKNDTACMSNPDKIGPDGDGKAGGCTNIHIRIPGPLESLHLLKRRGREQLAEITAIFDALDEKKQGEDSLKPQGRQFTSRDSSDS